jgi:hypothetical protein
MKKIIFFLPLLTFFTQILSQSKHAKNSLFPSYKGLVMAGYQGWFRAEGDGTGAKNFAYGTEDRLGIDMWPDVSEYKKTYPTSFKHADGKTAMFFSSYDQSTVDLHFKWMRHCGDV